MKQLFYHSYRDIEIKNIVYENKKGYFYESKDTKNLYIIEKNDVDKIFKTSEYGYYSSFEVAKNALIKYLKKTILDAEKQIKKYENGNPFDQEEKEGKE